MYKNDQAIIITFISICSLLILVLSLFILSIIKKHTYSKLMQKEMLEKLKAQYDFEIINTKLQVQESTLGHLSREIHDNIGQKLSLVKLHLNAELGTQQQVSPDTIRNVIQVLSETMDDLRAISRSLNSDLIVSNGLIKALENEIVQLNRSGLYTIKLRVIAEEKYLTPEQELVLFRIAQESLNNTIKHAEASSIILEFDFGEPGFLHARFHDDGQGFDPNKVEEGNGTINIRQRARMLGGTATIQSAPGNGTTVHINIPLYEKEPDPNHAGR